MPFAAAVSYHPVSAYATGEVIGETIERLQARPDLAVVAARPGHAGALEDIVATVRRLLRPTVLLGAVADGVGAGASLVDDGPALALWLAAAGDGATDGAPSPARACPPGVGPPGRGSDGVALTLAEAPISDPDGHVAGMPGGTRLGGTVRGPLALDGEVGDRPVGAVLDGALRPTVAALSDLGPVGQGMVVTDAVGTSLLTLDGEPALPRLASVVRDHVPAGELTRVAGDLRLGGSAGPTVRVLGTDPATGAVVVDEPPAVDRLWVHLRSPEHVAREAGVMLAAAGGGAGALVLVAPGQRPVARQPGEDHGWELLPEATLSLLTPQPFFSRDAVPSHRAPAAVVALFP
ncbi:MAG TPA: FIST N-terminal domain-containing protein [Acidimicrobiales bacterium]|nr:FIST N-terminal domain-containing protein [Acidimicrobiales bacterium]